MSNFTFTMILSQAAMNEQNVRAKKAIGVALELWDEYAHKPHGRDHWLAIMEQNRSISVPEAKMGYTQAIELYKTFQVASLVNA